MVELNDVKKCEDCAWLKLPAFEGFARCQLKGLEVWTQSQACEDADTIGVF